MAAQQGSTPKARWRKLRLDRKASKISNYAIVIGIDSYENPDYNLTAAVDDALHFTRWALGPGGVAPENLRLHLSPTQKSVTGLPDEEANRRHIVETIQEFQQGLGQGGDRLYFYFAGHGVSPPDATYGGPLEPVMIPADVTSLRTDSSLLIGFSDVFSPLANVDPATQFFFVDACRDFLLRDYRPAVSRSIGPWIPPRTEPGPRSAQYILYATSPGQSAYERKLRKRGVFATALLDGLQGKGSAKVWSQRNTCYEVRFSTLVTNVVSRIKEEVIRTRPRDWKRYVQIPQKQIQGGAQDPVLATFTEDQISRVPIRVRVRPSAARKTCQVEAGQYLPGQFVVVDRNGPPIPLPCTFQLLPGEYSVLARAEKYRSDRETCTVYEPTEVDFNLIEVERLEPVARPAIPCDHSVHGSLHISAWDPNAVVSVWDSDRRLIISQSGGINIDVAPGIYRVALVLPEGAVKEKTVEVMPGETTYWTLGSPPPQLRPRHLGMLRDLGISTDSLGYMRPSEYLDGVAKPSLASLLSFAAFGAIWPGGGFHRLRSMGIESFEGIPEGGSALLLLVGVGGNRPAPGVTTSQFLRRGHLIVRDFQGEVIDQGGFEVLPRFSAASQRRVQVRPGPLDLELRLPGFRPTHYGLTSLPDRVAVLVAVAEDSGEIAVQQYLPPLRFQVSVPVSDFLEDPRNVRRLEMAQRYYALGQPIPDEHLGDLLWGKWVDPLLGCLAGYSLIRVGMQNRFEEFAMQNMLHYFDGLPDSHILAGMCDPVGRSHHFLNALNRGLPVFSEGFQTLYKWCYQENVELPLLRARALVEASKGLLSASPWTAWTTF